LIRSGRAVLSALAALCCAVPALAHADRVAYFLQQLEAPGFKVRLQAAYILGTLGDKRAVPPLVKALDDSHYAVRGAAAIAIGSLGDLGAVEALVKVAADEEAWVRAEVMKALGRLRAATALETVVKALDDADWKVRYQAARAAGMLGDSRAIFPLARVIEAGIDGSEVIEVAKKSILKLAPSATVADIEARLKTNVDKHERAQAAVVLGVIGNKEAVPALIGALADAEPYVRGFAALALASLADARASEPLKLLTQNEAHPRVRSIAKLALSMLERRLAKTGGTR
jgi:HEAT repeat protein